MAQKKKKTTKKEIERKKLQRQLAYYRNKYYDLGLKSEGFRRAITSSILDTERELKFLKTNLDFKSVFSGKYFNINGKKVYYEGIKAVKKQIDILKKQTSPNYKRDLFISNYARAMREQNFSNRNIKEKGGPAFAPGRHSGSLYGPELL